MIFFLNSKYPVFAFFCLGSNLFVNGCSVIPDSNLWQLTSCFSHPMGHLRIFSILRKVGGRILQNTHGLLAFKGILEHATCYFFTSKSRDGSAKCQSHRKGKICGETLWKSTRWLPEKDEFPSEKNLHGWFGHLPAGHV